jgi:ribonuclease G
MLQLRKEIMIGSRKENEVRIAITENGRLVELFVENQETVRHVGEIFLGKVAKVIPGMNAAFINVGLGQDAFLHFSDVGDSFDGSMAYLADAELRDDDDEEDDLDFDNDDDDNGGGGGLVLRGQPQPERKPRVVSSAPRKPFSTLEVSNINLQPNQDILVQVTREAFANKGVRVTSRISLPGRFVVLVPFEPGIGISKKVYSVRERRRLRRIIRSLKPREIGVIVRTVAENKEESALRADIEKLLQQWDDIQRKMKEAPAPQLVFQDTNITSSVLRDLFTYDVTKIISDDKKMYKEVLDYVQWASPNLAGTVELYKESRPLFDVKGVEEEIEMTMSRKVPLPSGGYLFIEKTEAMVVIDVNSGRYAARREQELNSLKTNLEAARETARQLRLRDIGGIIVIDFIDMVDDRNKKKVYDEMKKEMRRDRAKSSILGLTDFGLMQITRQRIRQSISDTLSDACPACGGTGKIVNQTTVDNQIERWLERYHQEGGKEKLTLNVHPHVAERLGDGFFSPLRKLGRKYRVKVRLGAQDEVMRADEFRFMTQEGKDITADYMGKKEIDDQDIAAQAAKQQPNVSQPRDGNDSRSNNRPRNGQQRRSGGRPTDGGNRRRDGGSERRVFDDERGERREGGGERREDGDRNNNRGRRPQNNRQRPREASTPRGK